MQSTLTPKPNDDPHDVVVVAPDAVRVAPSAPSDEELSNLLQHAARYRSKTLTGAASEFPAGPAVPPVDTTFRPADVNDVRIPGRRPSMGGRALRAFTGLLLAACIGAAAIAWQSSGTVAKQMVVKWAPSFILTSLLAPEKSEPAAQPAAPADQADAANTTAPQPAPPQPVSPQPAPPAESAAEAVAPAAAASSVDSAQLQSMARDLASVGQEVEQLKASIEQLKAGQQQMSRDAAKISEQAKASGQTPRPRISAISPPPPPRSAAAPARKPMPPLPPPQAIAAPTPPPAAAPYYAPRQVEPPPQATQQLADPELASVPRPPMPVR